MSLRVYLAGPDVFLRDALSIGRRKRDLCRDHGLTGLFPMDQEEPVDAGPVRIFRANRALMEQADIGLFNLTPFRGPSADAGTVFELGYMCARGKRVHGYTSSPAPYLRRVAPSGASPVRLEGRCWDERGHAIEDFDLLDNLMIVRSIEDANGSITAMEEPRDSEDDPLAAFTAFRSCLATLGR